MPRAAPVAVCAALVACAVHPSERDLAPETAPFAADPGVGQSRHMEVREGVCEEPAARVSPFVVHWSESEREALREVTETRLAAVRMEGCELTLLPACALPGSYHYRDTSLARVWADLPSVHELSELLPFAQPRLQRSVLSGDHLGFEYGVRGSHHASRPAVFDVELGEGCEGATHFVLHYLVGAYRLDRTASRASMEKGATTGLDAESVIFAGGKLDACPAAEGCSAPLRLRLVGITPGEVPPADHEAAAQAHEPLQPGTRRRELDGSDVQRSIRYARSALAGCVLAEGSEGRSPVGKITYELTVGAGGNVTGAAPTVAGQLEPDFVACVTGVMFSLRFPRSRSVRRVQHPLEFK